MVGLKPATLQLAAECLLNHLATNCYIAECDTDIYDNYNYTSLNLRLSMY